MEQEESKTNIICRGRLIVVDDDSAMLKTLSNILSHFDFDSKLFSSAEAALKHVIAEPQSFDVILTDLNMPGMNGLEFIKKAKELDHDTIAVFLTGYPSSENAVGALRSGAFDFLEKPFSTEHLLLTLDKAVSMRRLSRELENHKLHLADMLEERTQELRNALKRIEQSYMTTMDVIAALLEAREPDTARHSKRVCDRAVFLTSKIFPGNDKLLNIMERGARLHDIGKIGIPDAILNKPGKLTPEEMQIMRTHTEIGYKIISSIPDMQEAAEIVRSHHERFDGQGYPKNLKGEEIYIGARIFSIIDTYDAIRFERCYKGAISQAEALVFIDENTGTQFDPEVVRVFKQYINEIDQIE